MFQARFASSDHPGGSTGLPPNNKMVAKEIKPEVLDDTRALSILRLVQLEAESYMWGDIWVEEFSRAIAGTPSERQAIRKLAQSCRSVLQI